ncbi:MULTISPECIES: hypothetical protein [unclassified Cyanobium]|uniref:hypothetical protein n=1 Tax=unclassified Cyanobium TaxID=2627006 RepID=UPI0020CEF6D2|nr:MULTISPECIES: hypothetical protein [unclassified Cyanobium]MCP9835645.1 hypothetical protein [Cyanobium sp. La Preciosa 7G6]MCP9938411.1 hypothetical protein [Cyanobium sp. Aljojuca 7A6]
MATNSLSTANPCRSQSAVAAGIGGRLYWLGLTVGRFGFGGLIPRRQRWCGCRAYLAGLDGEDWQQLRMALPQGHRRSPPARR